MKKTWTILMMGMLTLVMALSVPLSASAEEAGKATTNAKPAALYAKITGASKQEWSFSDIELTYSPNSVLSLGAVEFTLPKGFQATTKDIMNGKALKDSYILNNGQTVRIPLRLDLLGISKYTLKLSHKVLPAAGTYTFVQKIEPSASVPHFMQKIRLILIHDQLWSHRQILADAK